MLEYYIEKAAKYLFGAATLVCFSSMAVVLVCLAFDVWRKTFGVS